MQLLIVWYSSLLGADILIRILFSDTVSLLSSHNVRDQVLSPKETTPTIIIFVFQFVRYIYQFSVEPHGPVFRVDYASMFLRNVGVHLQQYTVSQSRRILFSNLCLFRLDSRGTE
jgi:hypothetical protein